MVEIRDKWLRYAIRFTEDLLKIFDQKSHHITVVTCISSLLSLGFKSGVNLM